MGGLHDHLDWLLPVKGSHIPITLAILIDGGVEGKVQGVYYTNTGLAVVVDLRCE